MPSRVPRATRRITDRDQGTAEGNDGAAEMTGGTQGPLGHDLSSPGGVLERVHQAAAVLVEQAYGWSGARLSLLQVSENATFLVERQGGRPTVLRVHRLGYHSRAAVESELAWVHALRAEAGVATPVVVRAQDGSTVVECREPVTGVVRHCVMFEHIDGQEPTDRDPACFHQLGSIVARMHQHSRSWRRPATFTRAPWDLDAAWGPRPRWGRWQDGVGVGRAETAVLGRLEATLRRRLEALGTGPDHFGLIHADTRPANLLVHGDTMTVIDFDDCGPGWFLYDLGAAFSFFEHAPEVPELMERWLEGYGAHHDLPAVDRREIWSFVLLRSLLLVAWLGSHPSAAMDQPGRARYTAETCTLAEWYLSTHR